MAGGGDDKADLWEEGHRLPSTSHTPTGPLQVRLDWRVTDGRPECDGVHVTSPSGAPITSGDLRALDLPKLIRHERAQIVAAHAQPPTRGLMRRSDAKRLAEVAEVYRAAFTSGQPPTKAVADHFRVKRGTASGWVAQARAAGILPPTSPGAPQA
jgi:hypothetical protein